MSELPGTGGALRAAGCLLQLVVYPVVLAGPPMVLLRAGPAWGIVAAVTAVPIWWRIGPRPIPGLLPGMMAVWLWLASGGTIVVSVFRLVAR